MLGENWLWLLLSFLLGVGITLFLILRKVEVSTASSKTTYAAAGTGAAAAGLGAAGLAGAAATDRSTSVEEPSRFTSGSHAAGPAPVIEPEPFVEPTPVMEPEPVAVAAPAADPVFEPEPFVEPAPVVEEVELEPEVAAEPVREAEAITAEAAEVREPVVEEDGDTRVRGFVGTAAAAGTVSRFGEGSFDPLDDGSSPDPSYTIKGNEDSMLFHPPVSPYYGRTKAEVWFDSEDRARSAGFTRWDEKDRSTAVAGFASMPAAGAYGEGSADPLADGASPHESFTIKGNADSMLFHPPVSPYYGRTKAEVWFDTEDRARSAGFTRWDEKDRDTEVRGFASVPAGAFGEGSADPLEGGASPHESFTIKGNADSMLFHTTESPYYGRTIAEVWFDSEDRARAAGFTRWDER
ncbi:sunset domain-containing protein [Nocardioides sp. B-3]|uniref:sunset domain-containing protein n=1 Tax=Nocardioides sp. B-3 TaxID=2895565 RepID=UPI00300E6A93